LTVERGEEFRHLHRIAERGGSIRIAYNADLDSASAASILFSAARRLGVRAVARSYSVVLDLSRIRPEISDDDLLVVVGLLVKGEPTVAGIKDIALIEPGDYRERGELFAGGVRGSASLMALDSLKDYTPFQLVRALVGHYAARCYLWDAPCDDAAAFALSKGGDLLATSPETLMLALRKSAPIDMSIRMTLYPDMAAIIGDQSALAEGLRAAGICGDSCPALDDIEGARDRMSALRSYLSGILPHGLLERLTSNRVLIRPDAGIMSDLSDLSLLEDAIAFKEGPQAALADSLSSYPRAASDGLRSLIEISKYIPKAISSIRRSASKGTRAVLVEDLDVPGAASAEVLLKSATFPMVEDDQLLVMRLAVGIGGTYIIGSRHRAPLDGLLKEVEGMGAHHVSCGPLTRLWIPPEEDRRFQSLLA
jgi:hypothetical protein